MKIIDQIFIAFKRIRKRKLESFIIILAIALGVGVISLAIGLTLGAREQRQEFNFPDSNFIEVSSDDGGQIGFDTMVERIGESLPEPVEITVGLMYEIKENVPAAQYLYVDSSFCSIQLEEIEHPHNFHEMTVVEQEDFWQRQQESSLRILPTTVDYFYGVRESLPEDIRDDFKLISGNFFTEEDIREGNRVIIIGSVAAERLFPDEDPIGKTNSDSHSDPYTVIGVFKEMTESEDARFFNHIINRINSDGVVPITAQRSYGENLNIDELDVWQFKIVPGEDYSLDTLYDQVYAYMSNKFLEGFSVRRPFGMSSEEETLIRRLRNAGIFAATIGLVIASINILNLMLAKVLRRTMDIGIFTALGLSKNGVFKLFIWEALLLGFFGAILGFFVATGGASVFQSIMHGIIIIINWQVFLAALSISIFVSLLFGVYPAIQAANIDPVDALRTE
ncbi:ABC transporter permease [Natronospora cellulosivora (SeqCode)]